MPAGMEQRLASRRQDVSGAGRGCRAADLKAKIVFPKFRFFRSPVSCLGCANVATDMAITRRTFLKASVGGAVGVSALGFDLTPAYAAVRQLKIRNAREYKTICPYCAVGCGTIAYTHGSGGLNTTNTVIHVEGDPDNPINGGTLCPKGASQMQLAISPRLRKSPMFRAAGANEWEEVDWDFAMDWFARKFKETRDNTFVTRDGQGRTVNRTNGIAWVGSATVANEDAYLITKTMRALGLTYIDHQARI